MKQYFYCPVCKSYRYTWLEKGLYQRCSDCKYERWEMDKFLKGS